MDVAHYGYGIVVFEGCLSDKMSNSLISFCTSPNITYEKKNHLTAHYKKGTSYNEFGIDLDDSGPFKSMLSQHITQLSKAYFSILGLQSSSIIKTYGSPTVKKYCFDEEDKFALHYDAVAGVANRGIVMIWYLNDVEIGGETVFPLHGVEIKPRKGNCLIFPPFWNFPHLARKPINTDKYTLNCFGFLK